MKFTTLTKIWLVSAACFIGLQSGALAATAKVAVLPFQINADKDYTFLQKGIVDMLSSRLSWAPKVQVMDPVATANAVESLHGMSGDTLALAVAKKLEADYALHGSITVLGESVSIDAKMLDVNGTRAPLTFFKQTQGMGNVIPQIDLLASEINTKVFGRPTTDMQATGPSTVPGPGPAQAQVPQEDIHANPEKMIQDGRVISEVPSLPSAGGIQAQRGSSPLNPAFEASAALGSGAKSTDFWKSRNFSFLINGMDVGDVNHDGVLETVLVTPQEILIYQFTQGRMQKISTIDSSGRYNIGVDVGDINGNGTPEIFVTSLNSRRNVLDSQVLEFDGQVFKPIVKDARWYFRVVQEPSRGALLLGQRQKAGGADPLSSPVFMLSWNGKEYLEGAQILPAHKANLLGIAYGDIRNDKSETIIGFDEYDKLRLMAPNGEVLWSSSEYYGGSPVYFALPRDNPGDPERPFYLPTRTRAVDLEGDQKTELLVVQNIDSSNRKLAYQRFYKDSRIMALVWDGLGMAPVWQTRKISSRIQDLTVADFDNDGRNELLAAVVSKEGSIIGTQAQSALIAFDLNQK